MLQISSRVVLPTHLIASGLHNGPAPSGALCCHRGTTRTAQKCCVRKVISRGFSLVVGDVTLPREGVTLQLSPDAENTLKDSHFAMNLGLAPDAALSFTRTILWDFFSLQL